MEIVRACLRVLKHHGVIAFCDMFFYSNRYEATERAVAMLAGQESKLLVAATEHAIRSVEAPSPHDVSPSLQPMASSPATEGSISSGSRAVERLQPGNSRIFATLPATPSSEVHFSSSSHRKGGINDLKMAVAIFFGRCERYNSFGDTWIALISGSGDARATRDGAPVIDWKRAFRVLDHRRLASFGVVHGLIRRVHRFPRLTERHTKQSVSDQTDSASPQIFFGPTQPTLSSSFPKDTALVHLQRHTNAGSNHSRRKTASPTTIMSKMDGMHCDDELACEFQKSLDELLEIVASNVSIALIPATYYGHS